MIILKTLVGELLGKTVVEITPTAVSYIEPTYITSRRKLAISWLGVQWVGHPEYVMNVRHSINPDIYMPARETRRLEVSRLAQESRLKNPKYHAALRLRAVVGVSA